MTELTMPASPKLFEILTWQDTRVVADVATGALYHGQPIAGRFGRVVGWMPDGRMDACVLFAVPPAGSRAAGTMLRLGGDPDREVAISLLAVQLDGTEWGLRHPITGLHLCAVPGDEHIGVLVVDRAAVGPWERFKLHPVSDPPDELLAEVGAWATLLATMDSAPGALAALMSERRRDRLRPILRLLRADDLDWLGRLLRRDPAGCRQLGLLYPDDPWARLALPALQWSQGGQMRPGILPSIDPSLDNLAEAGFWGRLTSLPHIVNARARRDRAPTRRLCLLATVRNEGLYLLEWIAFHQALGVEAFFIYSNDNDDGSDAVLKALASAGIVNWIANTTGPGVSPQYKAYGHAFQVLPEILDYRWVGIIDLDEFIVLDRSRFAFLPDLISVREREGADAITMNWLMFGPNGLRHRTGAPMTSRFTTRDPLINPHVKSFSRPHRFLHSQAHYPVWEEPGRVTLLGATGASHPRSREGDASAFAPSPNDDVAWVAHYHTKSAEEFILRRSFSRGDVGLAKGAAGGFFGTAVAQLFMDLHRGQGQVHDTRAVECVPDLVERVAALRAMPGVDQAMCVVESSYRDRLAGLAGVLAEDARFTAPGSPENWFLQTLTGAGDGAD